MVNADIAHVEWSQCFGKSSAAEASEGVYIWKRVKGTGTRHVFEIP